jgi:hypothetical protein
MKGMNPFTKIPKNKQEEMKGRLIEMAKRKPLSQQEYFEEEINNDNNRNEIVSDSEGING